MIHMSIRSMIKYFLAINALIFMFTATCLGANGQAPDRGADTPSIRFESPRLEEYSGVSILIYEAVRSERFPRIEMTFRWSTVSDTDDDVIQTSAYVLRPINDFGKCAAAALSRSGRLGGFSTTPATTPLLFQPTRFDHELVEGYCVIAYPADELKADLIVSEGSLSALTIKGTANAETIISNGNQNDIWGLTGSGRPPQFDLWNLEGSERRPDTVGDAALIRSIQIGGEMQNAALRVIQQRLREGFVTGPDGRAKRYAERIRQTSEAVITAILDSKLLLTEYDAHRFLALQALVAAGETDQQEAVMSQVIQMLGRPSTDRLDKVEREFRERVNTRLDDAYFDTSEGGPLYRNTRFLSLASELALLYGDAAANQLASAYSDWLYPTLLNQLVVDLDIVRMAAYGDTRDELVDALIAKADHEGGAPPPIQARIELLITGGFERSPQLQNAIDSWCARPGGLLPYGDRDRAEEFCLEVASDA